MCHTFVSKLVLRKRKGFSARKRQGGECDVARRRRRWPRRLQIFSNRSFAALRCAGKEGASFFALRVPASPRSAKFLILSFLSPTEGEISLPRCRAPVAAHNGVGGRTGSASRDRSVVISIFTRCFAVAEHYTKPLHGLSLDATHVTVLETRLHRLWIARYQASMLFWSCISLSCCGVLLTPSLINTGLGSFSRIHFQVMFGVSAPSRGYVSATLRHHG